MNWKENGNKVGFFAVRKWVILAIFFILNGQQAYQTWGAEGWAGYTLKTPETRTFWIEPSTSLLGPGLNTVNSTLDVRYNPASETTFQIDHRLILHLHEEEDLQSILGDHPLTLLKRLPFPATFLLDAETPMQALGVAAQLAQDEAVLACYPVDRKPLRPRTNYAPRPADPFFTHQWHLEQRDPITSQLMGGDINVRRAWGTTRGEGVHLAVVDTGMDLNHPDLRRALQSEFNRNFRAGNLDGRPESPSFFHGTAVGGLIGAEQDNVQGVSGVAPLASLSSWVIFGLGGVIADSLQLSEMYEFANEEISIQNHSWGNAFPEQVGPSFLERLAISNAFHEGRSGKGIIMVRAGGNDRTSGDLHPGLGDVNDDGYTSMHTVISAAATRRDGRATSYSNWGASLMVAAPGGELDDGLFTTDVLGVDGFNVDVNSLGGGDYITNDRGFIGTSAAAPLISGLAGLALSVNPELSARDIQQILIFAARHVYQDDPDLIANSAGFVHSHHVGFGIPDAGEVVRLAERWPSRPELDIIHFESELEKEIPDQGLRLKVTGDQVPNDLKDIPASTTIGVQPDHPTGFLPMSFQGRAIAPITDDLSGKGAFIRRGTTTFDEKIRNAANANASFVVIYNHQNDEQLIRMVGTDYAPLPAFFIAREQGDPLSDLVENDPTLRMQLEMNAAVYEFEVEDTLLCEHVELIVDADHPSRGQLRIVLESPSGTKSVLQRLNLDDSLGPVRWAYRTTRHFFEPSAGIWKVHITDQDENLTGVVQSLRLSILGTALKDTDRDGLDDDWERNHFGNLTPLPHEDPDQDGYQNAKEQILQSEPLVADVALRLFMGYLDEDHLRLQWPSRPGFSYEVRRVTPGLDQTQLLATVRSQGFESEWVIALDSMDSQYFQVTELEAN